MQHITKLRAIRSFIQMEWSRILRDSEKDAPAAAVGGSRISQVHRDAQTRLIHELEDRLGQPLAVTDMEYALDLFNTICLTSVDYLSALKENKGASDVLRQLRESVLAEAAQP